MRTPRSTSGARLPHTCTSSLSKCDTVTVTELGTGTRVRGDRTEQPTSLQTAIEMLYGLVCASVALMVPVGRKGLTSIGDGGVDLCRWHCCNKRKKCFRDVESGSSGQRLALRWTETQRLVEQCRNVNLRARLRFVPTLWSLPRESAGC